MPTWLYHITPISNLAAILQCGKLLAKSRLQQSQSQYTSIAYEHIQERRADKIVPCSPGGVLRDYIPFYFAPRSPMLYAIHSGYVKGYLQDQESILHLLTTAEDVSSMALRFAFTDGHAVIRYTSFYDDLTELEEAIDWEIMKEAYWNDTLEDGDRKRRRQAEFLVYQELPWHLIRAICVINQDIADQVQSVLNHYGQSTPVRLRPKWYYDK